MDIFSWSPWEGEGGKNWSKFQTDSTKKWPTWGMGERGVKNLKKLPMLFMNGPLCDFGTYILRPILEQLLSFLLKSSFFVAFCSNIII
jgi:hypothetical protein